MKVVPKIIIGILSGIKLLIIRLYFSTPSYFPTRC